MKSWKAGLSAFGLLVAVGIVGCDNGDSGGGGTPAKDLNASGFWEAPLNGRTAAGTLTQNGGSLTGEMLLPPAGNGKIDGTINGYHMDFTATWDAGGSESGSGDFTFVNTSTDKLLFTGTLPSVGKFTISWRGPDYDHHSKGNEPLTYTPSAPTW